jgi:ribosomal protein S18 acetylase RimI-like enzyme
VNEEMAITVSNLSLADRADWEELYHGYAEFYRVPMNDNILDTVWSWIHDEGNPFFGLIARDGQGTALGLMHCRQMPSPLRGALVGFLDDLFVIPAARGQGVVESLYAALEALAREQGWPFVRWITAEDNYRGRAVYDRLSEKTHWVTYQMAVD